MTHTRQTHNSIHRPRQTLLGSLTLVVLSLAFVSFLAAPLPTLLVFATLIVASSVVNVGGTR